MAKAFDMKAKVYSRYGRGNYVSATLRAPPLALTKTKCKIGSQVCVSHTFDHLVIVVFKHDTENVILEALMEAGVDITDIENETGKISVFAANSDSSKAK